MELLFTSDLHGLRVLYQQLGDLVRARPPAVLILGGDLLPDGDRGFPYASVRDYIRGEFRDFLVVLRREQPATAVLAVLGNHDWTFTPEELGHLAGEGLLRMLRHDEFTTVGEWGFLGLAYCPPAPYWIKDFERRDLASDGASEYGGYVWSREKQRIIPAIGAEYFGGRESLEELLGQAPVFSGPWVLAAHAPPAGTHLELLQNGQPVGSRAVRRFIERRQPALSLHGHLHESPLASGHCTDRIGRCLCVNPGQTAERLCAVRWDSSAPERIEHSLNWRA